MSVRDFCRARSFLNLDSVEKVTQENCIFERWGRLALPAMVGGAVMLVLLGLLVGGPTFDWHAMHLQAAQWTHTWWLIPVLILGQALPFAFALPGSLMFLVIGLLYDPFPATAMITAGGVLGSTAAYHFSRLFSLGWVQRVQGHRIFRVLQGNTNLLMLCAMRTLPGFPHSIINYGSGLLHVPLKRFVLSAVLGYLVKGLLYATILHNVVDAEEATDLFTLDVLWPLLVLAVLFIAGFFLQKILGASQSVD